MRPLPTLLTLAALAATLPIVSAQPAPGGPGRWVFLQNGKLAYGTLPKGDHIMDFSSAGYLGGGIKIPTIPVVKSISPSGNDDSAAIQAALDDLAKRPLDHGTRGALLLRAGTYNCPTPITIKASGIVLRGEGPATILRMTGKPHQCILVQGPGKPEAYGDAAKLTDPYIPSGSTTISVSSTSGFKPGDPVLINRPATEKWVHFMGMDTLVRSGKNEHWVSGDIHTERTIKSIDGNKITLDVPLTDSFDSQYITGATVAKYADKDRLTQVGLENFRITAPPQHVEISDPLYYAIFLGNTADSWVRSIDILDTTDAVAVSNDTARLTVEDVAISHTTTTVGGAKPADFSAAGTQILFYKCRDKGDDLFYFVTGPRVTGPIVLLDCTFHGHGSIQPHQRWATGLLIDNCSVPEGGIDLIDRGIMGSGHGWTIGWSVAWNCTSKTIQIEQPPGATNWAIGCTGEIDSTMQEPGAKTKLPPGIYDSQNAPVLPQSLYLAQLKERLPK